MAGLAVLKLPLCSYFAHRTFQSGVQPSVAISAQVSVHERLYMYERWPVRVAVLSSCAASLFPPVSGYS